MKNPVYFILFIALVLCEGLANAQNYDPLSPPNTFRQENNPEYWKNRMPFEGYWQQDVHYHIKANIDETTDIITGSLQLTYWNNSPDELNVVYFHLYQNAFQPDSYNDDLQKNNNVLPYYSKHERDKHGTLIDSLFVNGKKVKTELDNTILKVYLNKPLVSGEFIEFNIDFRTFYGRGTVRRRMKTFNSWGFYHYDGVHWYPRISVYDRKFGWTTDQHLGREFYGDFGTYDVELTFAANYVVAATGFLQNRENVLPDSLMKKLDIRNFSEKAWNSKPSVITPYDSTNHKTWIYHAENVHDFAFTADPSYRIGVAEYKPEGEKGRTIKCYSFVQEPHASLWQNAADFTAEVVEVYSKDFGMYVYHKMIVADARDGMEYPMLTLDGGNDPGYRGLLAHEIGHNWFFGQVGNNETYRAALDEGFTQFLTAWSMEKIDGSITVKDSPKSRYVATFRKPEVTRERRIYTAYIKDAVKKSETTLNTHSDAYNGALRHGGGYRMVYYKTAAMLFNLQYVLGDELFLKAMQHYFDQWKICHPYFIDFRNSIIQFTKVDLNWFFDQWLETAKTIDYGVKSVKKGKGTDEYIVKFKRYGRQQMPIDFQVKTKEGPTYDFHIPNTWFVKKTDAKVLPKWYGWDKLKPTYKASIRVPGKVKDVVIDPTHRLADANMLDNSKQPAVKIMFDSRLANKPDWKKYEVYASPDIWYNAYDGIKAGFSANGSFMGYKNIFNAHLWFNTGLGQGDHDSTINLTSYDQISFSFTFKTPLDKFSKGSYLYLSAKALDGLNAYKIGFDKKDASGDNRLFIDFQSLYRADSSDLVYLLYPELWNEGKYNNFVNLGIEHKYAYKRGNGDIVLALRSSALGDYDYSTIYLEAINRNTLGKFGLNTRFFMQYGSGTNLAPESQLYLAGANPEEMMDNKYTRSEFATNDSWLEYGTSINHFHAGGGLNLRGYSGYYVAQENQGDSSDIRLAYRGNSGAALNIELEFDRVFGIRLPKLGKTFDLKSYLFADLGTINYHRITESIRFTDVRADAGLGITLTIKKWGALEKVKPLTFRFDMPFFINRTPATEPGYVSWRWVLGINRAF